MTPQWILDLPLKELVKEERLYSALIAKTPRGEEYDRLFDIHSYILQEIAIRTGEVRVS